MSYEKQTWINDETPLDATHMNHIEEGIEGAYNSGSIEQIQIDVANWTSISLAPYTVTVTKTLTTSLAEIEAIELINDNAILFANCGFAIKEINAQNITIIAINVPTESVTLKLLLKKII